MILRSRMTNMSSKVMLQKACSRSLLPELSSMSLMRTSVISTAGTPLREAVSRSAGHDSDPSWSERLEGLRGITGRVEVAAQPEVGAAAPAHQVPVQRRAELLQGLPDPDELRSQRLGGLLEPVEQAPSQVRRASAGQGLQDRPDRPGPFGNHQAAIHVGRAQADR